MFPCRLRTSFLIFALHCLTAAFAIAQDSFLDEFRTSNRSRASENSVRRPEFLSTSESHDVFDPITDDSASDEFDEPLDSELESPDDSHGFPASEISHKDCVDECEVIPDCEIALPRFRKSCYQGSQFNFGYLHDDPDAGLAVRTFDLYTTFAIPLGSMEHTISFVPYYRADWVDAAAALDVPDTLYETGVKMLWRRPVNERFSSMMLITPSVRSDFETSDGAFRLFGMGLLTWKAVPEKLALSGGVVYTGREDFPVLPAMGLLWTPTPEWKLDLQFPSPRVSRRIAKNGGKSETWAYLSGVFGGNTWAVTRASGASDILTIRDLRFVAGIEHLLAENRGVFFETGCVFNRSLEYTNVVFERDLDSTWMLRAGLSF